MKTDDGKEIVPGMKLLIEFSRAHPWHSLLMIVCLLIASVIVSRTLRHGDSPYASQRQKLSAAGPGDR